MEETGFSEKKLLMKENVRKYGSISSAGGRKMQNNISYIRHEIQKDDTLPGLALRYGVSMEQIKRTNRLLTDTIFIRQYLLIPVPTDSPVNSKGLSDVRRSHSLDVQASEFPIQPPPHSETCTSTGSTITASSSMTSSKSSEPIDPDEENRRDIENFLSKVDSAIALTKKSVEETRKQSDFLTKDDSHHNNVDGSSSCCSGGTYAGTRRKHSYEGGYQNFSSSSYDDQQSSRRHSRSGRQIKSSLHRLEKQQEELFEL